MARFGKHGKSENIDHAYNDSTSGQGFPYNPYNNAAASNDGPVPYSNKAEELERLKKKKKSQRSKAPKIIAAVVIVVVLALGLSGVAFANSAKEAKDDAQILLNDAKALKDQIVAGDMVTAKATSDRLSDTAAKLHDTTTSPLWAVASIVPVVGSDIHTVCIISDSAYVLINDVLNPAMDVIPSNGLAGVMGEDGAINVKVIQDLLNVLAGSGPILTKYAAEIDDAPEPVIEQLKNPVAQVQTLMSTLAPIADSAATLKDTLPAMMGANGKRTYLIIACTSAEMRSSVGFAGSFGLMTVDNGKISLGDFVGAGENPRLATSVPAATDEDKRLFRWESTVDSRDVTQIIDFSRVGEIESQIWEANGHGKVDGVIALDTVVLQRMLGLTGVQVTTPGGDILDENTTSNFLLNGVYKKYPDGKDQDAIFALVADAAAKSVFGNIGNVKVASLADVIKTCADQGRICVYMRNPAEEAVIEDFGFAGTVNSDSKIPETGVYMSACMGGKMYYYLASSIDVSNGAKNPDGSYTYQMKVTLTNTLTPQEIATLTQYITNSDTGYSGAMDFLIYLLAPTGGKISDINIEGDGKFLGANAYAGHPFAIKAGGNEAMNETTYKGNSLWYGWTDLIAGGKIVLKYKVTTAPDASRDLVVRTTPLAQDSPINYAK